MNLPARIVKTWQDLQLNFDAITSSLTAALARITALETRIAYIASSSFVGAWSLVSPGPTTGVAFAIPRNGPVWVDAECTAYAAGAGTTIIVEVWIDGVNTGRACLLSATHAGAVHQRLGPCQIATTLTAGTHYVAFKQTGGTSDVGDIGNITVIQP